MKVRTRFAPSPTGYLHIGGLRTALYGFLFAKQRGGDFVLRIEDTDTARYVDGSVQIIYDTMRDSGIMYDEGPDVGGNYGPYVQSERKSLYTEYAKKLVELGGAYYCFCTKERLESLTDERGNRKYDKHCLNLPKEEIERRIASGEPYVIRQNIPTEGKSSYEDMVFGTITVDYSELEDNILIKSDGLPTYNFANVVDDHLMKISHVIRGTEYLSSTPKYNLMYDKFGWERPHYIHLPIIMKDATRKLSKRYGDANFDDFVNKGYLPEAIVNYVALLGWSPKENVEKMTMEQMIELFSLDGVSKSPSIFDDVKLRWLNGEYLKELSDEEFAKRAEPFFAKSKVYGKYDLLQLSALLKSRVEILSEIPEKIDFLEEFGEYSTDLFFHKKMKTDAEMAKTVLPWIRETLNNLTEFTHDSIHDALIGLATEKEMKNGQILWPARVALSGKDVTPGGAIELALILGKEESLRRIDFSLELLQK
jgi:glutamyl-tRNA synthetase